MARPKSEDKRDAIVAAAIQVFAERGLSSPTSAISKAAGVAEGTLFTYFPTKDDLINGLYREIKMQIATALMSGFPKNKDTRSRFKHIWESFVNWGVSHPESRKVLLQLSVSERLTEETRALARAPFVEFHAAAEEAIAQGIVKDVPLSFLSSMLDNMIQAAIDYVLAHPKQAAKYRAFSFDVFWDGISAR